MKETESFAAPVSGARIAIFRRMPCWPMLHRVTEYHSERAFF